MFFLFFSSLIKAVSSTFSRCLYVSARCVSFLQHNLLRFNIFKRQKVPAVVKMSNPGCSELCFTQNRASDRSSSISDTSRCENGRRVKGQSVQNRPRSGLASALIRSGTSVSGASHGVKAYPRCPSSSLSPR